MNTPQPGILLPPPNLARYLSFSLNEKACTVECLAALREQLDGEMTVAGLRGTLGDALRPIVVGPGLLTFLDQAKRNDFMRQWRQRIGRPP